MFGASLSELCLLIKSLINIGRAVDLFVITKQNTHSVYVHRNCKSGLAMIYKHAAHKLVLRMLQVVEVALTDDSTPGSLLRAVVRRGWSPVALT